MATMWLQHLFCEGANEVCEAKLAGLSLEMLDAPVGALKLLGQDADLVDQPVVAAVGVRDWAAHAARLR